MDTLKSILQKEAVWSNVRKLSGMEDVRVRQVVLRAGVRHCSRGKGTTGEPQRLHRCAQGQSEFGGQHDPSVVSVSAESLISRQCHCLSVYFWFLHTSWVQLSLQACVLSATSPHCLSHLRTSYVLISNLNLFFILCNSSS